VGEWPRPAWTWPPGERPGPWEATHLMTGLDVAPCGLPAGSESANPNFITCPICALLVPGQLELVAR
jgi:hypothetical protein